VSLRNVHLLLVIAIVVHSSPIPVTLMMEALRSSVTSVRTRTTQRYIPEDAIVGAVSVVQKFRRLDISSVTAKSKKNVIRNELIRLCQRSKGRLHL
jgi:hypothetical protein